MKKISAIIIACMLVMSITFSSLALENVEEKPGVKIIIDGKQGTYSNVPIMVNDRTLLPLREILVNLGVSNDDQHIIWDGSARAVTIIKDNTKILLKVGSNKAFLNGEETTLDAAPVEYKDHVYIPARFVAQSFGKKVDWDSKTDSVLIGETANSASNKNEVKEVTVGTAQEFVNEIGSNKRIILKSGVYDLSAVNQASSSDGTIIWEDVSDGKELDLKGIQNLTIEGSSSGTSEIRVTPRDAYIINFQNTKNINIKNITAGHTPAEYKCDAGVFGFTDCEDISISNSHLYGCGSEGFNLYNTKRLNCIDTIIDHCSLRAISINTSESIAFNGCKIINHEAYADIISAFRSSNITFEKCEMSGNNKFSWSFIEASNNSDITINNCKISNNSQGASPYDSTEEVYFFKTVNYGGSVDSKIVVKDSEISNNKSDFLTDNEDAVTFDNCTMKNNVWD